jgi:hypothetical protein
MYFLQRRLGDAHWPDRPVFRKMAFGPAPALSDEKRALILGAAQRIGWAFGWSITGEHLGKAGMKVGKSGSGTDIGNFGSKPGARHFHESVRGRDR